MRIVIVLLGLLFCTNALASDPVPMILLERAFEIRAEDSDSIRMDNSVRLSVETLEKVLRKYLGLPINFSLYQGLLEKLWADGYNNVKWANIFADGIKRCAPLMSVEERRCYEKG